MSYGENVNECLSVLVRSTYLRCGFKHRDMMSSHTQRQGCGHTTDTCISISKGRCRFRIRRIDIPALGRLAWRFMYRMGGHLPNNDYLKRRLCFWYGHNEEFQEVNCMRELYAKCAVPTSWRTVERERDSEKKF